MTIKSMTWEPPEIVPPTTPGRPDGYPPVPMVYAPGDELRSRVYEQMLARRTVFLDRPLDTETATLVSAQLLSLEADDADERVTLIVNSPGGPLEAVSGLLDTIDLLRCPVDTTCLGQAAGTAAVVVAAGSGRRRAGAGAQFRLRVPEIELSGSAQRLGNEVAHLRTLHDALIDRLATATRQDRRLVARDIDRGRALSAEEAVAYRLVDEVVRKKP